MSDERESLWRREIRDFLAEVLAGWPPPRRAGSWMNADRDFSRALGKRGWIGLTWPQEYGGGGRSAMDRHILIEELLAAGAPVGAHWVADRQIGPMLLRFGTPEQCAAYLPGIAAGDLCFAIGMSEPDSGSDLASVSTRAVRVDGGYRLSGTKLWTSNAHIADFIMVLCRTDRGEGRHAGLSQLIVPAGSPGVTIRPVLYQSGAHHFNEVIFQEVFVPSEALIGTEGAGWSQVTAELAYERSGPERFLSNFVLFSEAVRKLGPGTDRAGAEAVGRLAAHTIVLRHMSKQIAARLSAGEDASADAAIVKALGADLEQSIPEEVRRLIPAAPVPGDGAGYEQTLAETMFYNPSVSLRGGTREILYGIIARDAGLR